MFEQNQVVKSCAALVASFFLSSCNSTSIPGVSNFNVGVQTEGTDQHLFAGFQAANLNLTVGGSAPIPGLAAATVSITPALPVNGKAGGTVFQFDVDLSNLGNGITYADAGLPDGRPLPGIDGGILPRWEFTIDGVTIYLYLQNSTAFGFFIPIDLEDTNGFTLPETLSIEIDDSRGNLIGEAYAIPTAGSGTSSGLLVLIPFINNASAFQTSFKPQ
jgi:hypothetical protein